ITNEEPMSSTLRTIIPPLIALLTGYGLMQMGNTLQGTLLSVRGGIEGFAAREIDPQGRSHSNFRGTRGDRLNSCSASSADDQLARLDRGPCVDRLLLCRI